jgi:hypothetical protein
VASAETPRRGDVEGVGCVHGIIHRVRNGEKLVASLQQLNEVRFREKEEEKCEKEKRCVRVCACVCVRDSLRPWSCVVFYNILQGPPDEIVGLQMTSTAIAIYLPCCPVGRRRFRWCGPLGPPQAPPPSDRATNEQCQTSLTHLTWHSLEKTRHRQTRHRHFL